ncbi:hypothetical protein ACO22_01584 [Paracoccidioides brasiliensis]|uniref:DNA polymerase epsilon subunit D n=1 Tax=Paracoccidioides brasiliensis TaxID=121759 RepID=A0A1D2JL51_PARBR|nr:hypothetical protein ACO22_01584 [Paracoccidioides brasiliensis]
MPRKSTVSAEGGSHGEEQNTLGEGSRATVPRSDPIDTGVNVEDYLLPRTLTQRLAKGVLPPNTSIQKDALLAITKAATVFVSYLSSHANEETSKKTVTPQDVFAALSEIEFDAFVPRLQRELAVYTEANAQKRTGKKDRKAGSGAAGATAVSESGEGTKSPAADEHGEQGGEPDAKRVKRNGERSEVAVGRTRMEGGGGKGMESQAAEDDGDETEEMEEEDGPDEEEVLDDEEEEEEEEEEETTQLSGRDEDEVDIYDDGSDTARRRGGMHPDLDSGLESDSDEL